MSIAELGTYEQAIVIMATDACHYNCDKAETEEQRLSIAKQYIGMITELLKIAESNAVDLMIEVLKMDGND